jgi:hypothetical protein
MQCGTSPSKTVCSTLRLAEHMTYMRPRRRTILQASHMRFTAERTRMLTAVLLWPQLIWYVLSSGCRSLLEHVTHVSCEALHKTAELFDLYTGLQTCQLVC